MVTKMHKAGQLAQWLLSEDQSLVPNTHIRLLTWNSSSKESDALFLLLLVQMRTHSIIMNSLSRT